MMDKAREMLANGQTDTVAGGRKFIYVDKRARLSEVDGKEQYTVYKLDRALTAEELSKLTAGEAPFTLAGMRLPRAVTVSEYPAYVAKHQSRGDDIQEFG